MSDSIVAFSLFTHNLFGATVGGMHPIRLTVDNPCLHKCKEKLLILQSIGNIRIHKK